MNLEVSIEAGPKKAFASAVDWPGWSRSGKTEDLALEALVASGGRYAVVTREAGLVFEPPGGGDVEIVERVPGVAGTEFGVPSVVTGLDRRRVTATDAARLAALLTAAWTVFERVVAGAPAELRKGPRGGGRERDKIVAHVVESESSYARQIGLRIPQADPTDRAAVAADRAAMLAVLGEPSDGSSLAGRNWPLRYAVRRIAWHVLDHAWEIEDRSTPAPGPG